MASKQTIELELSESVTIANTHINLSDLIIDNSHVSGLQQAIADIRIGSAPRIGYSQTITRHDIEKILSRHFRGNLVDIHWRGANQVSITMSGKRHEFSEIESYATRAFLTKIDQYGYTAVIEPGQQIASIELPDTRLDFKTRISGEFIGQRNCVWVDVYAGNEIYRSIPVWINAIVRGGVLVAKDNISGKTEVTSRDFVFKDSLIIGNPDHYVTLSDLSDSSLLITPLNKGDVVLIDNIKPMPDVVGGKIVNVEISKGRVNIKLQGIAKNDANNGELLRVQLLHNNETVTAKVIGKQQVSII